MIKIGSLIRTWNYGKIPTILGIIINSDLRGHYDDKYIVFKIITSDGQIIQRNSFEVDEVKL